MRSFLRRGASAVHNVGGVVTSRLRSLRQSVWGRAGARPLFCCRVGLAKVWGTREDSLMERGKMLASKKDTADLSLREAFPGCELACDVYSALTARRVKAHPSLKKTGAVIQWGIDDARAIETWGQGIRLKEEWYFTQADEIRKLSAGYRFGFQLAGLFKVANQAHRILYLSL